MSTFSHTTSSKERKYDDSGGAGCMAKSLLVDVFRPQKNTSLCAFSDKFMTVYDKFITVITSDFMR